MSQVKRLEIVVDAPFSEYVVGVLQKHAARGWTIIRGASGSGDRGERLGDDITGVSSNHVIVTTCEPDRLDALVEDLREQLDRFGGMCLVSDATWVIE